VTTPRTPRHTRWAWALATFFGAGYLAPGPGTYGSIAAVLLWYFIARATGPTPLVLALCTAAAAVLITAIGIRASTIVAREAHREDPGFVVIDEVAGQLTALIFTPAFGAHAWAYAALALVLFRLFDIAKPWPIRRLEALPAGTGIMLDDIAAGLAALLTGLILPILARHLH
jgi:phosphatidylglycerophosphatase A